MDYKRELLKGNTQTIILAILEDMPLHGYGLAREIERRSGDTVSLKDGSLYPALHGLDRDGLVVSSWEVPQSGPARRVYRITEAGLKELTARRKTWNAFSSAIDRIIGEKPHAQPI